MAAKQESATISGDALERLCKLYWYPVYGYVRARGQAPDAARDLTQEFFLRLLDKQHLHAIEAPRGRFRWFLQTAVKNFLANEYDREHAQKRGGGKAFLSLEMEAAEQMYRIEPADPHTPETIFDRRWGMLLLQRAMERMRTEHDQFDKLQQHLTGDEDRISYRDLASELGSTEGAVRVSVHRLRRRFGEILREEIGGTVLSETEVDAELQFLMDAMR
jgi:RNA polymerase sigma-70 factor (ECF subfamily)